MTAKTVNYTADQTASVIADYEAGVPVDQIAASMGKSVRSIVAKLSREGRYKKPEYVTKSGDKPISKETLADQLAMLCGLTEAEADSLAKANKAALAKILAVIKTATLDRNSVV